MRRWPIFLACALACLRLDVAASAAPSSAPPALAPLAPTPHKEYDIPDSEGAITVRPVPEEEESTPGFLLHVEAMRKNNDAAGAVSYLQYIVTNTDITPRDRARGILELADCLHAGGREAESLCWLKIWMQMYPGRPEMGAVAFRIGTLYTNMGLPNLARDAYYQALSSAINQGQVQNTDDLKHYSRLTTATLWALAANEYQGGQWKRAAELFDRYLREATTAPAISVENAAFLQADCWYQLRQGDRALAAYEQALQQHPFNPLAPEARLRLYHLDMMKNQPEKAQGELQALIWTVRTVCPKEEAHWQQRAAETLLSLHHNDRDALAPLLQKCTQLPSQGKAWQKELAHYDRLVNFQTMIQPTMANTSPTPKAGMASPEQAELLAMQQSIDGLDSSRISAPTP
jgi:tetratricopeptide (TPR) repeat protein